MNKITSGIHRSLALLMLFSLLLQFSVLSVPVGAVSLVNGSYTGAAQGHNGQVSLSVTIADGRMAAIEITNHSETPEYFSHASDVVDRIIAAQSTEVDAVTGATHTSNAIKAATAAALQTAGTTVYLNGADGSDTNNGLSAETPVQTFQKAADILGDTAGAIMISGTISVADNQSWTLPDNTFYSLLRADSFTGDLISVAATGSLTLNSVVLDGGDGATQVAGTLVKVASGGTLVIGGGSILRDNYTTGSGGAVNNRGTVTLDGGVIRNNTAATSGGGILNVGGGAVLTISSGSILNNRSLGSGGGIQNDQEPPTARPTLNINGGSITGNTAATAGGGIDTWVGGVNMTGGNISRNTAGTNGGGINIWANTTAISGGEIKNNQAAAGGGIHHGMGNLRLSGSVQITQNTDTSANASNVISSNITVPGALSAQALIGVLLPNDTTGQFAAGYNGYAITAQDAQRFVCDLGNGYVTQYREDDGTIHIAEDLAPPSELLPVVYLAGTNGNDVNAGNTAMTAVKTFAKAKSLLAENGTIYITDMISVNGPESWTLAGKGSAVVKRHPSYEGNEPPEENNHDYIDGPLAEVVDGGHLTLGDITLDGDNVDSVASMITVKNGTLTMNADTVLKNQPVSKHNGGAVYIYADGTFTMNGGAITGNSSVGYGGGIFNGGVFNWNGGSVTNNHAGYSGGGILNNGTMSANGSVVVKDNVMDIAGSGSVANNLYLASGKYLSIPASLGADAELHIDSYVKPSNLARAGGSYHLTEADFARFTLDNQSSAYQLKQLGNNINLAITAAPSEHSVYLDGANGSDTNNGSSDETAVKSFAKALDLAQNGDTIYIMGSLTVADTQSLSAQGKTVTFERYYTLLSTPIVVESGGNLTLRDVVVDGGLLTGISANQPLVQVRSGGTLIINDGAVLRNNNSVAAGGAVNNAGSMSIHGGAIQNCSTTSNLGGGGIYNASGAILQVAGGTISGCSAFSGGGIENEGSLTISNGTITSNTTRGGGAGIHVFGEGTGATFTMSGGTIRNNNSLEHNGGGLFLWQCGSVFTGGTITENQAALSGAGVYAAGRSTMSGSVRITGNTLLDTMPSNLVTQYPIRVTGSLDGAAIGLSDTGTVAEGYHGYTMTAGDLAQFASDPGHRVSLLNNQILIAETKVSLDVNTLSLTTGSSRTLTASVTPDTFEQAVIWSSDNAAVASVSDAGVVTAHTTGTAAITAADTRGETATCQVTVSPARSGGGGGGGGTATPAPSVSGSTATTGTEAKTGSDGMAKATVTDAQIEKAVEAAKKASEQFGGAPRIEIKVEGAEKMDKIETTIPQSVISSLVRANIDALVISSAAAELAFDADALKAIKNVSSGAVTVHVEKAEPESLPELVRQAAGNRPVYDFTVMSGGQTISEFKGTVTVSIPYTPAAGEDPNATVVYWINNAGELEIVANGRYDAKTGTVSFSTAHFSQYVVGYNKVGFTDVAHSAWYADAVTFLAARGITSGATETTFAPDTALTRGQFITLLLRSYGISKDENSVDNFSDAGDTYYTDYLAAAKRLGIADGVGENKFAPEATITRQELFTLLYNVLKSLEQLPTGSSGKALSEFRDNDAVADWAREAMRAFAESGTVSGSDGRLDPTGGSTRAQMAQVLYNLLGK